MKCYTVRRGAGWCGSILAAHVSFAPQVESFPSGYHQGNLAVVPVVEEALFCSNRRMGVITDGLKRMLRPQQQSRVRLSDTEEIQSAFRREVRALFSEVGALDVFDTETGIVDGRGLLAAYDALRPNTFSDLGLKSEHVRVLKSLTFLLGQCARLEATKQNLMIAQPMFHPVKPTTPTVAGAMEDVIDAFVRSIGAGEDSMFKIMIRNIETEDSEEVTPHKRYNTRAEAEEAVKHMSTTGAVCEFVILGC